MIEEKIERYIDTVEQYPVYILVSPRQRLCDYFKKTRKKVKFTKKKLKEIEDITKKFDKMQKYLKKLGEEYE